MVGFTCWEKRLCCLLGCQICRLMCCGDPQLGAKRKKKKSEKRKESCFLGSCVVFSLTCSSLVYSWKHSSKVQLCCCRCCCCWFLTLSASFTTSSWMLPNKLNHTNTQAGLIVPSNCRIVFTLSGSVGVCRVFLSFDWHELNHRVLWGVEMQIVKWRSG